MPEIGDFLLVAKAPNIPYTRRVYVIAKWGNDRYDAFTVSNQHICICQYWQIPEVLYESTISARVRRDMIAALEKYIKRHDEMLRLIQYQKALNMLREKDNAY